MSIKKMVQPYQRHPVNESFDVIIIGSGIGGLAAGALLAKFAQKKVLILERHYTPGGFTHVFHRPGYEWDVGVHYVGDVSPGSILRTVFDVITDGQLAWADMGEVYDRIIIGDEEFAFPKGRERLRTMLKQRFPGEEAAIDTYFAVVKKALSYSLSYHAEKVLPEPFATVAGPFLRFPFLRFSNRTTRQVLESLTKNQKLIAVLTGQYGDYGLPPAESSFMIHAMVANHYFEGGYYPVGGSERIAATILPLILAQGGRVLINAEVAQVVVDNGHAVGVRMASDGAVLRAPIVISDAGIEATFHRLLPKEITERYGMTKKLRAIGPSAAHICLYLGLNKSARELGLPKANLWIYPDERHEENLRAMMRDPDGPLPLLYVSFPSAKDPDFERRHPGRATLDVITVAPYEWFSRWEGTAWKRRGEEYEALKKQLAERMLAALDKYVPQARPHIEVMELSTPLTTRHFCSYDHGEIYGLAHTPERFRQRWLRPRTPIRGLYLTGQDVVTCGLAGALFGGVLAASAVLRKNLIPAILAMTRRLNQDSNPSPS